MSDVTFKAEVSLELADQSNDTLGLTYNMQGSDTESQIPSPLMRLVSTQATAL